jgi:twinkle protein
MLKISAEEAFEARGLDIEVASRMGASFAPGKFIFEYMLDGEFRYRKVRTMPEKGFRCEPSGVPKQFWNLDAVRGLPSPPSEPLVICEGEFDAIAVAQAVGGYVLSVPNGGAGKRSEKEIIIAEDGQFSYLWEGERLRPEVEQFNKIILCTDADEPGTILRDELALRIGEPRCWYVSYPKGCKDANDVLKAYGPYGVRTLIDSARPMRPGHLVKPSEIPAKATQKSFSTGWIWMDPTIRLVRPELFIVTGEPGHGKGQWIRSLVLHLAEAHGWRTALLAPEDPANRLKRDMMRFAKRRYFSLMSGMPHWDITQEESRRAAEWCDQHFRVSTPPEDEPITLDLVEKEMESAALHHDCQVFVLDPWNEVEHIWASGLTETQYIDAAIRRLKRKARRLCMLLIIAAHPTKLKEGEKANLYSINGSATWRNKADHGVIIYRPSPEAEHVELIVEKCKDHETMGVPGSHWMVFHKNQCEYARMNQSPEK